MGSGFSVYVQKSAFKNLPHAADRLKEGSFVRCERHTDALLAALTEGGPRNNQDAGLALAEGMSFTLEEQHRGHRVAAKKGELQLIYFVNGVIDEVLEDRTYVRWLEEAQKRADELGV